MKKLTTLLFLFVILFAIGRTYAQQNYDYAIGLRAGNPFGGTAKYYFTEYHAGEGIIGLEFFRGLTIAGLYEYNLYLAEGANWYGGGGISLGFQSSGVTFGFDAIIGVEFTLPHIPINFGIDWKPAYVFGLENRLDGLLDFALSIRYVIR